MSARRRQRILEVVATDDAFEPTERQGARAWARCLACARCNPEKDRRHDPQYGRTTRSVEVVRWLLDRRRSWMRPRPPR
ncbi:MAG TPA: hypothetical protein VMH40_21085 [Myxococcaceae bacterium]|nr:hypothetical protein [Myxococcaceae bacterium]